MIRFGVLIIMHNTLAISGGFGDSQSNIMIACLCPAWAAIQKDSYIIEGES